MSDELELRKKKEDIFVSFILSEETFFTFAFYLYV